jgi:hypothetical protein
VRGELVSHKTALALGLRPPPETPDIPLPYAQGSKGYGSSTYCAAHLKISPSHFHKHLRLHLTEHWFAGVKRYCIAELEFVAREISKGKLARQAQPRSRTGRFVKTVKP